MSELFDFQQGELPLLVSFPHNGSLIPDDIAHRLTETGRASTDTDWHVRLLYDFLDDLPASVITANYSRYVIDLNRSADNESLYPERQGSALCPKLSFDGMALYADTPPDEKEVTERINAYWRPYHDQIRAELDRIKSQHGYALLWDAHSIRGEVPELFDGHLPDLNIGTFEQKSAAPQVGTQLYNHTASKTDFSVVLNGRFKGGFITRHYGQPQNNFHAVQMEINQQTYLLDESMIPPELCATKQQTLSSVLQKLVTLFLELGAEVAEQA